MSNCFARYHELTISSYAVTFGVPLDLNCQFTSTISNYRWGIKRWREGSCISKESSRCVFPGK